MAQKTKDAISKVPPPPSSEPASMKSPVFNPKAIRIAAGLTLMRACVFAGVAENTMRVFELDQSAVSSRKCEQLTAFYKQLAQTIAQQATA